MNSNCDTRTLLIIAAVILIVYLLFNDTEYFKKHKSSRSSNSSNYSNSSNSSKEDFDIGGQDEVATQGEETQEEIQEATQEETQEEEEELMIPKRSQVSTFMPATIGLTDTQEANLEQKFISRNKAVPGTYKTAKYSKDTRNQEEGSKWNNYFNSNNNIIGGALASTRGYAPLDETGDKFAMFATTNPDNNDTCGSNQNCPPEDLFDVDKVLPQEVTDDWFTVLPEPISVKNRHLINVTKPIGINTIGTSLRNSSYDIRGAPSCPKSVISPFLNSSIEPDLNFKPLF